MRGFINYSKVFAVVLASSISFSTAYANNNTATQNSGQKPAAVEATTGTAASNTQNANPTSASTNDDPLKPYNKVVFSFNSVVNSFLITPIAKGYNLIIPNPLKKGISNFFANINSVTVIANDILQLKLYQAWSDIWRLAVNSSVGIGGLFDVATHMGLERHREEFGLTLAYWGWENSSYFIIPVIGPSTVRDAIGLGADYFLSVYPYIHSTALSDGLLALFFISYRAEVVDLQEIEAQAALDRYAFEKNAYLQHRAYRIQQNKGGDLTPIKDNYVPDDEETETTKATPTHKSVENKQTKPQPKSTS